MVISFWEGEKKARLAGLIDVGSQIVEFGLLEFGFLENTHLY